jgi:hypothetical protein
VAPRGLRSRSTNTRPKNTEEPADFQPEHLPSNGGPSETERAARTAAEAARIAELNAEVARLNSVPKSQYLVELHSVAERLKVKVSDLDELVTTARRAKAKEDVSGKKAANNARLKNTVGKDVEQEQIAIGSRILSAHRQDLRWSLHMGWLCWDGSRWRRDENNQPVGFAKEIVRQIYIELADEMDDEEESQ